jgi:hypothetical protein
MTGIKGRIVIKCVMEGFGGDVYYTDRLRIRPRFMRDVSHRDQSTTVLGTKVAMPIGIAPTAMQRMAHPDGECGSARGQCCQDFSSPADNVFWNVHRK